MSNIKKNIIILIIVTVCISIIAYTDLIIRPGYLAKTLVKAPIFLFVPILYSLCFKKFKPFNLVRSNLNGMKTSILLGIGLYAVVLTSYFIADSLFNLDGIKTSLENNLGINGDNFVAIALYVSIVNSFLEEWFFRGFIFTEFRKTSRLAAYSVNSLAFSIYHIAIMDGMFDVGLLILILVALFIGGIIFSYLNEKNRNIYSSWFCHAFANFAMNTIGFVILYL